MDEGPESGGRRIVDRSRLLRAVWIGSVPILSLVGLVALGALDLGAPTYLGVGVLLFAVIWFWFRSLGRLAF